VSFKRYIRLFIIHAQGKENQTLKKKKKTKRNQKVLFFVPFSPHLEAIIHPRRKVCQALECIA
jgi:hypothetical protein